MPPPFRRDQYMATCLGVCVKSVLLNVLKVHLGLGSIVVSFLNELIIVEATHVTWFGYPHVPLPLCMTSLNISY